MNRHILEKLQIVGGFTPINMASGANTGDYVSLKNYGRCAIVLFKGAGFAGEDPIITLSQATDVSGSGVKSLTTARYDHKSGTLAALGQFTTVAQTAAGTVSAASSAAVESIVVIDIKAEDLDIDGGFDCLKASVADVGTTSQIGGLLYLLHEPRIGSSPLPSAIAD